MFKVFQLESKTVGLLLLVLASCSLHTPMTKIEPQVEIPEEYRDVQSERCSEKDNLSKCQVKAAADRGSDINADWWQSFESPELQSLVEQAFSRNQSIQVAWRRLDQMATKALIAGAELYPTLNLSLEFVDRDFNSSDSSGLAGVSSNSSRYALGGFFSYELDLWGRVAAARAASLKDYEATEFDVRATYLAISTSVAEKWFSLLEASKLLQLLDQQLGTSRTLLELTELRYSNGQGSAIDVLQQKEQLLALEAEIPAVRLLKATSEIQLLVLLGLPPQADLPVNMPSTFPKMSKFSLMDKPASLLLNRPDLQASQKRIAAADMRVAQALASRLPQLSLGASYELAAGELGNLFEETTRLLTTNLLYPVFNGGSLQLNQEYREQLVLEELAQFTQDFLEALGEVEIAQVSLKQQKELVRRLQEQREVSNKTLAEARVRYTNGLSDYLPVITAVQKLQALDRRIVSEQRKLLSERIALHRAVGGKL